MSEPTVPYDMGPIPDAVRNRIPRGRPTFRQNISGHIYNAMTQALGDDDPWWPLSRRLEIAEAAADAVLAFLAPFGLDDEQRPVVHGASGLEVLRTAPANAAPSPLPDGAYWIES